MGNQDNLISTNEVTEKIVLGFFIVHTSQITKYILRIKPEYFEVKEHKQFVEIMLKLYHSNVPIDELIIKNSLYDYWPETNWNKIIDELYHYESYQTQIDFFVNELLENNVNKQLLTTAITLGNQVTDKTERINSAILNLMDLKKLISIADDKNISKLIDEFKDSKGIIESDLLVKTGLIHLDEKLNGGFEQKQLIIIGARPGSGKTALLMNLCNQIILEKKKKILFLSFKMNPKKFLALMVSNKSRKPFDGIVKEFTPLDYQEECLEISEAEENNMFKYYHPKNQDIVSLLAEISSQRIRNGLDVVIIDSLQQLEDLNPILFQNKSTVIGKNLLRLKQLAEEMNILIIIGSELSKAVDKRRSGRPNLSDLKDSGWIEELADKVLLIYKPENYHLTEWDDGTPLKNEAEIQICKNNLGQTGNVRVRYLNDQFVFLDKKSSFTNYIV